MSDQPGQNHPSRKEAEPPPQHDGPCTRSVDPDGKPLGYCAVCFQDMPDPCPTCGITGRTAYLGQQTAEMLDGAQERAQEPPGPDESLALCRRVAAAHGYVLTLARYGENRCG